jgi:hypothetical protein
VSRYWRPGSCSSLGRQKRSHALSALYDAAKADHEVPDEDVDQLRESMHETTDHVDTSHRPTAKRIIEEVV